MKIAHLVCDKTPYALPEANHKGENLRAFFGVPDTHDLFVEMNDGGDDCVIRDDNTSYFVEDGNRFYTANRKINNS